MKIEELKEKILSGGSVTREEALALELGKSRTECWTTEIGFVLAGISHAEKHLRRWMKPVRVPV